MPSMTGARTRKRKKRRGRRLFVPVLLLLALLVYGNVSIRRTAYTVVSDKLPAAFEGFRIAQVSDLHGGKLLHKGLLRALETAQPHLIAITGDLTDDDGQWPLLAPLLEEMLALAPVYYVTGNHEWADCDTFALLERLEELGVVVLRNAYEAFTLGDARILIAGVDDPNGFADMKTPAALAEEMRSEGAAFSLLLSHRPDRFTEYARLGFDLTLSGHIHGGLLRLPFVGGVFSPGGGLFPAYDAGLYREEGGRMLVSRGLAGVWSLPRVFNRPELPVITLRCA